jgi:hypothetical protein
VGCPLQQTSPKTSEIVQDSSQYVPSIPRSTSNVNPFIRPTQTQASLEIDPLAAVTASPRLPTQPSPRADISAGQTHPSPPYTTLREKTAAELAVASQVSSQPGHPSQANTSQVVSHVGAIATNISSNGPPGALKASDDLDLDVSVSPADIIAVAKIPVVHAQKVPLPAEAMSLERGSSFHGHSKRHVDSSGGELNSVAGACEVGGRGEVHVDIRGEVSRSGGLSAIGGSLQQLQCASGSENRDSYPSPILLNNLPSNSARLSSGGLMSGRMLSDRDVFSEILSPRYARQTNY